MPAPLKEGARLRPFVLGRKIAVGGMAEVWAAQHEEDRTGKSYALKLLHADLVRDPQLRTMFHDEVNLAVQLRHPNIVRVEGQYEDQGLVFLVMELVDGKDLRRVMAAAGKVKARIPVPLAIFIARDAARGLGYAHAVKGDDGQPLEIVHRDVSPHNLMIDRAGRVKVLDFGVARARERLSRTATGVIKGKISYMAPEQMLAQPVTAQADIFALGIVLWEMLAMRSLFGRSVDADVMQAVCQAHVPPIQAQCPEVPPPLAKLVHSMLALQPRDRPESMRVVENVLTRMLATAFHGDEFGPTALGRWAGPFLETPKRKTAMLQAPKGEPGQAALLKAEQDLAPAEPVSRSMIGEAQQAAGGDSTARLGIPGQDTVTILGELDVGATAEADLGPPPVEDLAETALELPRDVRAEQRLVADEPSLLPWDVLDATHTLARQVSPGAVAPAVPRIAPSTPPTRVPAASTAALPLHDLRASPPSSRSPPASPGQVKVASSRAPWLWIGSFLLLCLGIGLLVAWHFGW